MDSTASHPGNAQHPADEELLRGIKRAVTSVYARFRAERPQGALGDVALEVLGRVQRYGPQTMGDLAEHFHVSGASMNQSVGRLEAQGCVTRGKDPEDGRRVLVAATEAGAELAKAGRAQRDAWLHSHLDTLPDADRETLRRAAQLLLRFTQD